MPKFVTSQHIEIDLTLASLGERIVAFIIDAFVVFTFLVISIWMLAITFGENPLLGFIPMLLAMFYTLILEIFFEGQTLGKRAMNLRVVKEDGTPAGIGSYLLRWLLRIVDIYIGSGGVAVISIISTSKGQRLGDLAAGTIVIKVQKEIRGEGLVSHFNENHRVVFPSVRLLNDGQIELIRNALDMRKDGLNDNAARLVAEKTKTLLSVESDMPDVKFLHTVIADYEFMMNQE